MMFWKKKKKHEDDHLDVLDEIKEPFSMQRFIDDQIVARYQNFRKLLDRHGILFFLLSPFQYRNRLLIKIGIIIIGVMIGLIPRSMGLIEETKDRNAASELAQIAGSEYNAGLISIRPLKSSQYEEKHIITFEISGDTVAGVPSTAEKYEVKLRPERGVSHASDVTYGYDIIPISNDKRLLIIHVDNSKQNDETGIYTLQIRVKGDTIKYPVPMSIVLSDDQETTDLYNENGIDLSELTTMIEDRDNTRIVDTELKLDEYLRGYELMDERLTIDGYTIDMGYADIQAYIKENAIFEGIEGRSTVRDIKRDSKPYEMKDDTGREPMLKIYAKITYDGKAYEISDDEIPENVMSELEEVQKITDSITTELNTLNRAKVDKFNSLVALQPILNKEIDITTFPINGLSIVDPNDDGDGPKKPNLSEDILSDKAFIDQND